MQTEYTYGFLMEFDDNEHEHFLQIKADIENLCRYSEKLSKTYNKNPLLQSVQISSNTFITCAVYNGKAHFGLLQRQKSDNISQFSSGIVTKNITTKAINLLSQRMEITAQNNRDITHGLLKNAWDSFLSKEKELDIER